MTKLAIVVMTILLSTSAFAQDTPQLESVRLKTETHKWELGVQCRKNLKPDTRVIVKTHPKEIRLDGRITIQQEKKRQACRVRELAVLIR